MTGGTTKTIGADDTPSENNVNAAAAPAVGDSDADTGDGSHRNRTLRHGSAEKVESDRHHPVVIYCILWLDALRCQPGRWDNACLLPATGRRSPCGINAYTEGA